MTDTDTNTNVLQSLMARGTFVRLPDGRRGLIVNFDRRTNMATIRIGSQGPWSTLHLSKYSLGDIVPTRGPNTGSPWARSEPHPRTPNLIGQTPEGDTP